MFYQLGYLYIIFCSAFDVINAAKILFLIGVPSPSHFIWNEPIIDHLATKGHQITALSANLPKNNVNNSSVEYILLENIYNVLYNSSTGGNDIVKRSKESAFSAILSAYHFAYLGCEGALQSKGYQHLLNQPSDKYKFDLIVHDFTCGPCLLPFVHKFNYPKLIGISAFSTPHFISELIGAHNHWSYIPHFSLPYTQNMNFIERIYNYIVHLSDSMYRKFIFVPRIDEMIRTQLHINDDLPNLRILEQNYSLLLVNTHPAIDGLFSFPSNVIQVGGLQIKQPKPVPIDLLEFIDAAQNGVVLFSLGTNVKGSMLTSEVKLMFLNAFKEFQEYHFLWKLDNTTYFENIPRNVMIRSWLPQNDVLAHPKTKAFITHGGLLSTHEGFWWGVPMIGMPIYVDQHRNVAKICKNNLGIHLPFNSVTQHLIVDAINTVLHNTSYTKRIKAISKSFRNQKESPLERASWWIESMLNEEIDVVSPVIKLGKFNAESYDVLVCFVAGFVCFLYLIRQLHDLCVYNNKLTEYNGKQKTQ